MSSPRARHKLVPALLLVLGMIGALVYREQLVQWFAGPAEHGATKSHANQDQAHAEHRLDSASLERVRAAFEAYEQARALLARDASEGLHEQGTAVAAALSAARQGAPLPEPFSRSLDRALKAAARLSDAADVTRARRAFADLSEQLLALAVHDDRLTEGFLVFECPMAEGFGKWFQHGSEMQNTYMGQAMLQCGTASDWSTAVPVAAAASAASGEIAHYTCAMHPSVRRQEPGECPICGMDLTPVSRRELASGTVVVDALRRQRIGVRTQPAERRPLRLHIRAVGEVRYDESRLTDVNLRIGGWVHKLLVDETGQRVREGQTLLTLYSPELYAAQLEYLNALRRQDAEGVQALSQLGDASRKRLRLLGMSDRQLDELRARGNASEHVPVLAPAGGHVLEKNVVQGGRIEAGTLVYRIADLSRVWIDAELYESDLPHVRVGQPARVELPYLPGRSFEGRVDHIYPTLQQQTRTGRARIVLRNKDLDLKPQMYANVELSVELGERLVIPDSAVIYTGPRRLVFVDLGGDRLRPTEVELGVHQEGYYEVTSGLAEGDVVVTSGNFLIAAESRIRSAAGYWEGGHDAH
jgi:Cu(I)/Ag(I) efflux system membrane fusion protein